MFFYFSKDCFVLNLCTVCIVSHATIVMTKYLIIKRILCYCEILLGISFSASFPGNGVHDKCRKDYCLMGMLKCKETCTITTSYYLWINKKDPHHLTQSRIVFPKTKLLQILLVCIAAADFPTMYAFCHNIYIYIYREAKRSKLHQPSTINKSVWVINLFSTDCMTWKAHREQSVDLDENQQKRKKEENIKNWW